MHILWLGIWITMNFFVSLSSPFLVQLKWYTRNGRLTKPPFILVRYNSNSDIKTIGIVNLIKKEKSFTRRTPSSLFVPLGRAPVVARPLAGRSENRGRKNKHCPSSGSAGVITDHGLQISIDTVEDSVKRGKRYCFNTTKLRRRRRREHDRFAPET